MEAKYSKEQFEGFTHRFIVELRVDNNCRNGIPIDIYSDSDDLKKLNCFINEKKSAKVIDFYIIHRATKQQDEISSKLIAEI